MAREGLLAAGRAWGMVRASGLVRPISAHPVPLGRLGDLEVRLAASADEVRRAQQLRYRVFYEELSAIPNVAARFLRRDADRFDSACDHLLVLDHGGGHGACSRKPRIVGTYRLLRQDAAERLGGFYSEGEFQIGPLLAGRPGLRFLELGRSCVLAEHRNKRTLELLWHGIWAYVLAHRIDVMFGCASLEGTDPERLSLPLSFLHHTAPCPAGWRVRAREDRRVEMNRLPAGAIDTRAALKALPPLIKGYLRLGAMFGDGAVVDHGFGTTDVCVVMPVAAIDARYLGHFGHEAERFRSPAFTPVADAPLAAA